MQDYLKVIHRLCGDQGLVPPADIATRLGVCATSGTGMLMRLAEGGWVEYESGGTRLTAAGVTEARRVIRRAAALLGNRVAFAAPTAMIGTGCGDDSDELQSRL